MYTLIIYCLQYYIIELFLTWAVWLAVFRCTSIILFSNVIYFSIYSYLFYSCFHSSSYSFFRSVSLPFIYSSEVSVFQTLILSILSINLPLQFVSPFLCFCLCFLIFQTFIGLSACLLVWLVVCLPAFHSSHLPFILCSFLKSDSLLMRMCAVFIAACTASCVAFSDLQPIFYIHELRQKPGILHLIRAVR